MSADFGAIMNRVLTTTGGQLPKLLMSEPNDLADITLIVH